MLWWPRRLPNTIFPMALPISTFLITNFQFGYFSFLFASIVHYRRGHAPVICMCQCPLIHVCATCSLMLVSCPAPLISCFHRADYLHVLELDGSYTLTVNLAFLLQAEGQFKLAWDELSCMLKEDSRGFAPALEARGVINDLQMGNTFGALLNISNAFKVSIYYN